MAAMPTPRVIANEIHCHRRQIASERRCRRSSFTTFQANPHTHTRTRMQISVGVFPQVSGHEIFRRYLFTFSVLSLSLSRSLSFSLLFSLSLLFPFTQFKILCLLFNVSSSSSSSSLVFVVVLFSRLHSCSAIIIFHYFIRRLNSTSRQHQVCSTAVRSAPLHFHKISFARSDQTNERTKKKKLKIVSFPSN